MQNQKNENSLADLQSKRQRDLLSLLDFAKEIHQNATLETLFKIAKTILQKDVGVGSALFITQNEEEDFELLYSYGFYNRAIEPPAILGRHLSQLHKTTYLRGFPNSILSTFDYFIPVLNKNKNAVYVLIADFNPLVGTLQSDLTFIETLVSLISVGIDNKKMFEDRIVHERLQREVELAKEIQARLIPDKFQQQKGIDFGISYLPHSISSGLSGDYVDIIPCGNDEVIWCIADVSGKGISAAFLMASIQASIRAWVSVGVNLRDMVNKLNEMVFDFAKGDKHLTLFIARYNYLSRKLQYVNAAHPSTILIQDNIIQFLKEGTTLIGVFEELPFLSVAEIQISSEAYLFNYTDGLVERDNGAMIDDMQLAEMLVNVDRHHGIGDVNSNILNEAESFFNKVKSADDITILSVRIMDDILD